MTTTILNNPGNRHLKRIPSTSAMLNVPEAVVTLAPAAMAAELLPTAAGQMARDPRAPVPAMIAMSVGLLGIMLIGRDMHLVNARAATLHEPIRPLKTR